MYVSMAVRAFLFLLRVFLQGAMRRAGAVVCGVERRSGVVRRFPGQEHAMDVGQDAAVGDGDAGQQLAQLLVVPHGQLDMAGDDSCLFVVPRRISCELEHLPNSHNQVQNPKTLNPKPKPKSIPPSTCNLFATFSWLQVEVHFSKTLKVEYFAIGKAKNSTSELEMILCCVDVKKIVPSMKI